MATPQEIRAWLQSNSGASDAQIYQAMQQYGVTPQQIAAATGGNATDFQQRFDTQGRYGQIRNWLGSNLNADDGAIYRFMQQGGYTPAEVAAATGGNADQFAQRYQAQHKLANGSIAAPGGVPAMQIPTGLAGSEQALGAGYESALKSLLEGMGQARTDMTTQSQAAQTTISDAMKQALAGIQSSGQQAGQQAKDAYGRAEGYMQPFMQQGQQVNPLLMALTGASGQDAFNKAFTESPVQQFLMERGNLAIAANAAATGGLGGANVQKEFMRYGQGIAGQALQDQINNLMGLSGQGFNAASNAANLAARGGDVQSGITQNTGMNSANVGMSGANAIAGLQGNLGMSLGNMGMQGGLTAGNYAMNTGQNVAAGRSQAGRDLAASISQTAGNLSGIAQNQGQQASDVYGTTSGNLANLLASYGGSSADILRWLAGAQATAAQNASGQYAGVPNTAMMPTTNLQSIAQLLGGAGTMIGAMNNNNLRTL
jgi:ribosomal protein L31